MNEDIRKNIVDESGKNSDNIVDIEGFAAEYEADAEFENLIKNGLDESWEDLGLSVSDDLIARTMDAIRNADANAKAFPGTEAPAKAATACIETAAEPVKTRNVKYRRFARIAAGIAAAALIGIFGIGVLKSGLFFSKKSADGAARSEANSNSAPMSMAANSGESSSVKNAGKASDSYETAEEIMQDMVGSENASDGYYNPEDQLTASSTGSSSTDLGSGNIAVSEIVAPTATPVPDFTPDNMITKTTEPGEEDNQGAKEAADEIDTGAGCADDPVFAPTLDADGADDNGSIEKEAEYLDIDAVLLDTDEEKNAQSIIKYIESVRGELLDAEVDTYYPEDTDAILFSAVWPERGTEAFGLFTRCDIYDDRVVYSQISVLDHIAPDFTVEEYMLENGEAVAAELQRLSGEASE